MPSRPQPTDATNGEDSWAKLYQTTQPTGTGIPEEQAAASVTARAVNGEHTNQSEAVPEPSTTGGQVSVQQPGAKADAEIEMQADTADQAAIAPDADTPTKATAGPACRPSGTRSRGRSRSLPALRGRGRRSGGV